MHSAQCVLMGVQIFKWERRKGWEFLLEAFLREFTPKDNVALYMKTSAYHSDSEFAQHMQKWAAERIPGTTSEKLPSVYVIDEQMSQERLRSLYAAVDCFVLPSRSASARMHRHSWDSMLGTTFSTSSSKSPVCFFPCYKLIHNLPIT